MKIVFFGTPEYVLPVLETLHKTFRGKHGEPSIVAVVTQPPKEVGRDKKLTYSAVDTWAHAHKVPIYFDSRELIKDNVEADLGIVAAYGAIIPEEVLNFYPLGLINLHFSTLPDLRGASPVHGSMIVGKTHLGVSIFKLDKLLDHGPIITQFKEEISKDDTVESLRQRVFERCAEVLVTLLPAYKDGKVSLKEQDHEKATYSKVIKKDHAYVKGDYLEKAMKGEVANEKWEPEFLKGYVLTPDAQTIERFIRAMHPWPGAYTNVTLGEETKILKLLAAHVSEHILYLDQVQLEGKKPVSWEQFKEGYKRFNF